jgi:hypothetical protein
LSVSSVIRGSSGATVTPRLHVDFDDVDVLEVAELGDANLESAHCGASSKRSGSPRIAESRVMKRAA